MQTLLGNNLVQVKHQNRQAVLLTLLREGAFSRVQLAKRLGLSNTTVTNLTAELLNEGLLETVKVASPDAARSVGRPRTMLSLRANARYVIGIHIGIGSGRVAVVNLKGRPVGTVRFAFQVSSPAELVLAQVAEKVAQLMEETAVCREHILGIGVGSSGHIDVESGICHVAPSLGWRNVPIAALLQAQTHLPVMADNNVRVMALAEAYFGKGRTNDPLAFVFGRSGIGAGLIVNGELLRGAGAGAGEIGHMVVVPQLGELCRCGQRGCLETLAAQPVLERQLASFPALAARLNFDQDDVAVMADILQLAAAGHPEVLQLLDRLTLFLGIGLVNLVNMVGPKLILLGGMYAQAAVFLLPKLRDLVRQRAFGVLGEQVTIEVASFGEETGVVGAGALALEKFFYLAVNVTE